MPGVSNAVRAAIAAAREPARETVRRWRGGTEFRALVRTFADCPLDAAEPGAARAEALLADAGWAEALLAPLVEALAADPFFEPPFRVNRDALRIGAVLFECRAATLTACVTSAAAMAVLPAPASAVFSGRVAVTRYVKAGGASLRRWRAEPVTPAFAAAAAQPCTRLDTVELVDGEIRRIDGRVEAQLLDAAARDVVTLVATIHGGAAPLMRECALEDGRLLRVASGDDRPSRTEMLLGFLRLAGRADAGACFEAATHDPAFHLRWAAMREWLLLDAHAALPRLVEMARGDTNAEVRAAAAGTLAMVERRLGEARCRA